jgi:enoyl-CoA hydratase
MDMILTGRAVGGPEALAMGLANRLCPAGSALDTALALADQLATLPQGCLRSDRRSAMEQWGLSEEDAAALEARLGREVLRSGEALAGAARFSSGEGRGGVAL